MEVILHIPDKVAERLAAPAEMFRGNCSKPWRSKGTRERTLSLYEIAEMLGRPWRASR
jgi:hypothetical protein